MDVRKWVILWQIVLLRAVVTIVERRVIKQGSVRSKEGGRKGRKI